MRWDCGVSVYILLDLFNVTDAKTGIFCIWLLLLLVFGGNMALSEQTGAILLSTFPRFVFLCHIVAILATCQTLSMLLFWN